MPLPPPPPPAPSGKLWSSGVSGGTVDRGALLKSIQHGKTLRKTVTNDRSAPRVGGNNDDCMRKGPGLGTTSEATPPPRLPGIGGLFSDGIPKLKSTQGGVRTGRQNVTGTSSISASNVGSVGLKSYGQGVGKRVPGPSSPPTSVQNSHSSSSLSSTSSLSPRFLPTSEGNRSKQVVGSTPQRLGNRQNQGVTSPVPPPHPSVKPPPPPPLLPSTTQDIQGSHTQSKRPTVHLAARARSFNHHGGGVAHKSSTTKDDLFQMESVPTPPTRTLSSQPPTSLQTQTIGRRRQIAPPPPQRPTKPPPMKPPSQPPPPPPPPHKPQHQTYQGPPQSNAPNIIPAPPTRRHSLHRGNTTEITNPLPTSSPNNSSSFEPRFAKMFKTLQYLPPPEPFIASQKTYPSRISANLGPRQGSMMMKRAPAPPPPLPKAATQLISST